MLKTPKPKLSVPRICKYGNRQTKRHSAATTSTPIMVSDVSKILLLVESLSHKRSKKLQQKINQYLQRETRSALSFIIEVAHNTASVRAVGIKQLEPVQKFKLNKSTVDEVIAKSAPGRSKHFGKLHPEFQNVTKTVLQNFKCEIMSFPILPKNYTHLSCLLVCLVNPKMSRSYIQRVVNEAFVYCLPILLNTHTLDMETAVKMESQTLLNITKKLFSKLSDLNELLSEILDAAKNLMKAETCALFLLEEGDILKAPVFHGAACTIKNDFILSTYGSIAGYVARTGKILNIKDPYSHPLFYKELDTQTGFTTKNILCFPISVNGKVIGSAELCNKKYGDFTHEDEESAKTFSIYCGLAIMNTILFKKVREVHIRTQLCNDLMMYHMKVSDSSVNLLLRGIRCPRLWRFGQLNSLPRDILLKDTPSYALLMFRRLKLIEKFNINESVLARFILYMQKGYRNVPYHNWTHALCVTHFAYLVIKHFQLIDLGIISHLEALTVLTSCLGHDIDHRGTTNAFQLKTESMLANLYSSDGSVMEHHHLSQTLTVLNTENCNFLQCLDNRDYRRCLSRLRDCIVATDLGNHIKALPEFAKLCQDKFNPKDKHHRELMFAIIMTCADLSDQSKGWKTSKLVSKLVYKEFFKQGDMEKRLGSTPMEMMDRNVACIPDLQVQFLQGICIPAFEILTFIFPGCQRFVDTLNAVVRCWEEFKRRGEPLTVEEEEQGDSMVINIDSGMTYDTDSVDYLSL